MGILNTLSFLLNHPLSQGRKLATLRRFAAWQIGARYFVAIRHRPGGDPRPPPFFQYPLVGDVQPSEPPYRHCYQPERVS
jgi:hypothetical protein